MGGGLDLSRVVAAAMVVSPPTQWSPIVFLGEVPDLLRNVHTGMAERSGPVSPADQNSLRPCGTQKKPFFLGTLNIRCRTILGTQKGTIILTTTHVDPSNKNLLIPLHLHIRIQELLYTLGMFRIGFMMGRRFRLTVCPGF